MARAAIDFDEDLTLVNVDWIREVFPSLPFSDTCEEESAEEACSMQSMATRHEKRQDPSDFNWPPCAC